MVLGQLENPLEWIIGMLFLRWKWWSVLLLITVLILWAWWRSKDMEDRGGRGLFERLSDWWNESEWF